MADYRVVDIRGRFAPADGTWGTRPKGAGVILHYNGGPAPLRAWRDPVAWMKFLVSLHSQRGRFAPGWRFSGLAYHELVFGRTVYRVMNWRADTPHCGNTFYNRNALGLHIPIGTGQFPREVGDGTLVTAMQRADDHLKAMGLDRNGLRGHREVGSSACPGDVIQAAIGRFRKGADFGGGGASEEPEIPSEGVFRTISGSFTNEEGADERSEYLRSKGFSTWGYEHEGYHRVQTGAREERADAYELARQVERGAGVGSFVVFESTGKA